jgi:hypothetical protein
VLLLSSLPSATASCDTLFNLGIIQSANQVFTADSECSDADGWTHYYYNPQGKLLLSIKRDGQNIGTVASDLKIKAGTMGNYGSGGFNLSGADYIDNDVWITANRFWQIENAKPISAPMKIRFYFHNQDVLDVAQSVAGFNFLVDDPKDLYMFTLSGGSGLHPISTVTQPLSAVFTLFDMVPGAAPDWSLGVFNGILYAEFQVNTLDIGGGAGFLIFLPDAPLSVSGNIRRPDGKPVPKVNVQAVAASIGITNANGDYVCPTLLPGLSYEVVPEKNIDLVEDVDALDLIALGRHLLGIDPIVSPYRLIAADADKDATITQDDLDAIRRVMLGTAKEFPDNSSWRFVRKGYVFPNPANPFQPGFPETIPLQNLTDSLFNQDFTGIKIGDVTDELSLNPPVLNTTFSLQTVVTCNPGDTVTFALKSKDFKNIRGFQFTLEWDAAVLEFLTAVGFSLEGFDGNSIGQNAAAAGQLTFVWFNPETAGSTLSDGTALCQLRFVTKGNPGSATPLYFTDSETPILLLHQNLSKETPGFSLGYLFIENNSSMSASAVTKAAGCLGEPTGSIDLSVDGAVPPLIYHWSNGVTTQDLANLPGGNYRVTISDASGNCPIVASFTVLPVAPINLSGVVKDMSCPMVVNGAINLQVSDGVPPFQFKWDNGSQQEDLTGLFQGNYYVTVTDALGCTATASFSVGNPNKIFLDVAITNASSPNASDGAVIINSIAGGAPPFTFQWNNGATTQSVQGVSAGDYIVTVTDAVGCKHVFGYLVSLISTSTDERSTHQHAFVLHPNPARAGSIARLVLSNEAIIDLEILLLSSEGKVVRREKKTWQQEGNLLEIVAPDTPGIYFIQLKSGEKAGWARWLVTSTR